MSELSKRNFLKFVAGSIVVAAPVASLLAATLDESNPAASTCTDSDEPVQYLFVQTAQSISFKDGKLSLHGIGPATLFFSDRPERITGHGGTKEFVEHWSAGVDSFAANPPNATLSMLENEEIQDVVVVLSDPVLTGSKLTYNVLELNGKLPSSGGPASLFIDIIGMPLTPVSAAGMSRRVRRRVYY